MALSDEKKKYYQSVKENTRREIEEIDVEIEEVLAKVKDRLSELQNNKKTLKQMYAANCAMLGVPNDLEEEGEEGES
jgi:hypothetical protein